MANPHSAELVKFNTFAMDLIRDNKLTQGFNLLKKVEHFLTTDTKQLLPASLWIMTLNNLSCYYQKVNNPQQALEYLQHSLTFKNCNPLSLAGTYLNLSTIRAQLGFHHSAASAARKAVKILSNHKAKPSTLALAYHSLAIELQAIGSHLEALKAFHTGTCIALEHLGKFHELTQRLKQGYSSCTNLFRKTSKQLPQLARGQSPKISVASTTTGRAKSCAKTHSKDSFFRSSNKGLQTEKLSQPLLTYSQRVVSVKTEAALLIQKVWRGAKVRRNFAQLQLTLQISKAERDAQTAISKLQSLRFKENSLKYHTLTPKLPEIPRLVASRRLRVLKEAN